MLLVFGNSSTYVNHVGEVTLSEVVQDACLIEVTEVSHVFHAIKLGRVHLFRLVHVNRGFLESIRWVEELK